MIDKNFLKTRFSNSFESYRENAHVQKDMAEKIIKLTRKENNNFANILEIGAGEGLLTEMLNSLLEYDTLTVNDLAKKSQDYALDINPKIKFIAGDIEKIKLKEKYNLIIANAVFQWIEDLPLLLANLKQHLTDNGLLVFSTFGPDNLKEIKEISGLGLEYFSFPELKQLAAKDFRTISSSEEKYQLTFPSAIDIIAHLRKNGTNTFSSPWSKGRLKNFCTEYEKKYIHEDGLILTYHAIFFVLQNNHKPPLPGATLQID